MPYIHSPVLLPLRPHPIPFPILYCLNWQGYRANFLLSKKIKFELKNKNLYLLLLFGKEGEGGILYPKGIVWSFTGVTFPMTSRY